MKSGERFDLVEVMACPGGCIAGAGQPISDRAAREKRGRGCIWRIALQRPPPGGKPRRHVAVRRDFEGRVHELLHVEYSKKGDG
jgi:NADH-quinone oxidoreductase subunit G